MPCEHAGPHEIIAMAEEYLREHTTATAPGMKFRFGENTPGTMWASVITEIERRGDQWIVTRIDRRSDALPEGEAGLQKIG